ncbi:hypothetical protein BX616_004743 [Lobosporangium transversale]|uniref:Tudor domain-containing protein n=1 Tax=Lobosporangium transversale TaxID=64571 RepID=A0A1Y2H268_9FUNG|nr:hypothetical protein BCR41DRAFT_418196 [Lobosporangium transversale]KAF9897933.1 hypothetical protein BX616_004743 [Lobosporangium transversale]ORZ28081.1 hypothetical protein BCR41DRAFT_418196 [Lobosporangium transversale]|eukprot:XP_021885766.1 hypothetical protein BCR41DRAFT_418196 [Lobosporangium transversale]
MDETELINLKNEVATIESALQADPQNEELLNLRTELLELVSLTENMLSQQRQQQAHVAASTTAAAVATTLATTAIGITAAGSPSLSSPSITSSPVSAHGSGFSTPNKASPSIASTDKTISGARSQLDPSKQPVFQPSPPPRNWAVGDRCRALYPADGKFYEATILTIGGSGQVFSVQYKGYESSPPTTVGPEDLKPPVDKSKYQQKHHKHNHHGAAADESSKKRGAESPGAGAAAAVGQNNAKKPKTVNEQVQKQMAWQNFAKGGAKKGGAKAAPVLKKSIFATPDNPEGKVGVVGSGKGMTQFQQRGKHIYGNSQQRQQQ